MKELADILQRHSVDTTSLQSLPGVEQVIYTLTMRGDEAIDLWAKLRVLVDETGYWPLVLGDDADLAAHVWQMESRSGRSVAEIIEEGLKLERIDWENSEWDDEVIHSDEYGEDSIRGDWPEDVTPNDTFSVITTYDGNIQPKLYMGLLPTRMGWETPAYLKFGDPDICSSDEHIAMLKYWQERYGAEPVVMTHDTIEMQVAKPPTDRDSALDLAREQFAYCSDIVGQGTVTLDALAAELLGGTVWFFWWD